MCREEAVKIWQLHEQFEAAGVRLVGIVQENIPSEVHAPQATAASICRRLTALRTADRAVPG